MLEYLVPIISSNSWLHLVPFASGMSLVTCFSEKYFIRTVLIEKPKDCFVYVNLCNTYNKNSWFGSKPLLPDSVHQFFLKSRHLIQNVNYLFW